ncbi:hypothetical protein ACLBWS_04915 [Brucellaceae bacterium D45D]
MNTSIKILFTILFTLIAGKSFAVNATWLNNVHNYSDKPIYAGNHKVDANSSTHVHIQSPSSSKIEISDSDGTVLYVTVDNFGTGRPDTRVALVSMTGKNSPEIISCVNTVDAIAGNFGFDLLYIEGLVKLTGFDPKGYLIEPSYCDPLLDRL